MHTHNNTTGFIHQLPDYILNLNLTMTELRLYLLIKQFECSTQNTRVSSAYAVKKLNVDVRSIQRAIRVLRQKKLISNDFQFAPNPL